MSSKAPCTSHPSRTTHTMCFLLAITHVISFEMYGERWEWLDMKSSMQGADAMRSARTSYQLAPGSMPSSYHILKPRLRGGLGS